MKFIVLIIIVFYSFSNCLVAKVKGAVPKTKISLNDRKGCAVRVAAWLSPSCVHCAEYFTKDIPKIIQKPGFCLDLHFLPHLYLLDMPVAALIWCRGSDSAYNLAKLFYEKQSEWLDISSSRDKLDDPKRVEDLKQFFEWIPANSSQNLNKITNYLEPTDPFLYVKIFALKNGFTIDELIRFLPNGRVDPELSIALLTDLPLKNYSEANASLSPNSSPVINYSPAFTTVTTNGATGSLISDKQLSSGILTEDKAQELLEAAGPFTPHELATPTVVKVSRSVKAARSNIDEIDEIQEVGDDEEEFGDDEEVMPEEDETSSINSRLNEVLDQLDEEVEGDIPAN